MKQTELRHDSDLERHNNGITIRLLSKPCRGGATGLFSARMRRQNPSIQQVLAEPAVTYRRKKSSVIRSLRVTKEAYCYFVTQHVYLLRGIFGMDVIVAVNADWGIGFGGTQQLVLSEDRRRFKDLTTGGTVIAGRKTLADFPGGKPLPGRRNIVFSRQTDFTVDDAVIVRSLDGLFSKIDNSSKVFVIGGASIYHLLLPYCEHAYVTKISSSPVSDVFFPDLDALPGWELAEVSQPQSSDGISFTFCVYKNNSPERYFTGERGK